MRFPIPCLLILVLAATPAAAKLKVTATLSDLGHVAEVVGGDAVEVTVLCPAGTDPHYLPAKPSLARRQAKADLLVYNGLELEMGWLPSLIRKARNPRIRAGSPGELDCSLALQNVLEVPNHAIDRGSGDIHPLGNPHYTLDPHAMAEVAHVLAHRLSDLDPVHAADYARRADAFAETLSARIPVWRETAAAARAGHVLLYHQTWAYLVHWLGLKPYGEIENRPGIAPSPRHVQTMIDQGRELGDVIVVSATWAHIDVARQTADRIGAPLAILPAATGAEDGVDTYIGLIDTIVERLAAAARERTE